MKNVTTVMLARAILWSLYTCRSVWKIVTLHKKQSIFHHIYKRFSHERNYKRNLKFYERVKLAFPLKIITGTQIKMKPCHHKFINFIFLILFCNIFNRNRFHLLNPSLIKIHHQNDQDWITLTHAYYFLWRLLWFVSCLELI